MSQFYNIREGQHYVLTLRTTRPLLHDSLQQNEPIEIRVLRIMPTNFEAEVLGRSIPTQIVLKRALDEGLIELR